MRDLNRVSRGEKTDILRQSRPGSHLHRFLLETWEGAQLPRQELLPLCPDFSGALVRLALAPPESVSVEPVCPFSPPEFEVNIVVLLHPDHLITENFPLKLCRM